MDKPPSQRLREIARGIADEDLDRQLTGIAIDVFQLEEAGRIAAALEGQAEDERKSGYVGYPEDGAGYVMKVCPNAVGEPPRCSMECPLCQGQRPVQFEKVSLPQTSPGEPGVGHKVNTAFGTYRGWDVSHDPELGVVYVKDDQERVSEMTPGEAETLRASLVTAIKGALGQGAEADFIEPMARETAETVNAMLMIADAPEWADILGGVLQEYSPEAWDAMQRGDWKRLRELIKPPDAVEADEEAAPERPLEKWQTPPWKGHIFSSDVPPPTSEGIPDAEA